MFGETTGAGTGVRWLIVAGSLLMVAGATAVGFAEAADEEQAARKQAMERECIRYGLNLRTLEASLEGVDAPGTVRHSALDWIAAAAALAIFLWAAGFAKSQPVSIDGGWMIALSVATTAMLIGGGLLLWRRTRFS